MESDLRVKSAVLEGFGERQRQLLTLLLFNKAGMTVDELAVGLEITRTAVNQHLAALERGGFVARTELQHTGGRPGQMYALTLQGIEIFPKQYSWFSGLLLDTLKEEFGEHGLTLYLRKIAQKLAQELDPQLAGRSDGERVAAIVGLMSELAYQAAPANDPDGGALPVIEAKNCVYHHLAKQHPEVCQFDLALLSGLMHRDVEQLACMVRGDNCCRFRFRGQAASPDKERT